MVTVISIWQTKPIYFETEMHMKYDHPGESMSVHDMYVY